MKKNATSSTRTAKKAKGSRVPKPEASGGSDWRVQILARVRAIIKKADPGAIEAVKWAKAIKDAGIEPE